MFLLILGPVVCQRMSLSVDCNNIYTSFMCVSFFVLNRKDLQWNVYVWNPREQLGLLEANH